MLSSILILLTVQTQPDEKIAVKCDDRRLFRERGDEGQRDFCEIWYEIGYDVMYAFGD